MGGSTTQTTAIKVANIQIQTSSYGLAKPVVYGTNRLAANLLWFGAFTATPHTTTTSQGGKGIGKVTSKDTTFTYSAAAILGLCEGPIAGIGSVWRDKDKTTLAALGLTLFTGTSTQAVWSYLTGYNVPGNWTYEQAYGYSGQAAAFTDQAINYSSTAYVAASAYDLGSNATVPNHGFEIQGKLIFGSGIVDASPAAIVPDMLTSTQYGAGMAAAQVGAMASYASYIQATGLFMSPTYETQRPTHDCLSELVDATNSAVVWSGGILNIIPYGDTALTGNGATYTPAVTPLFDFADDDFQGEDDPVRVTRSSPADAINRVQVEFLNRANQYNAEVVTVEDQDAIEKFGLKPASTLTLHMICNSATAKLAAQLYLQRMLYKRNTYEFDLDARYPMLEPMDVVTLTDAGQGMARLPVRITEIAEKDDGFRITAEDLPIGIAHAAAYVHDNGLRWQSIINVTPANCAAPIIFELPADPSISSAKGLSVAIAVGGQTNDPLYGGCRVWLSLDGTNYKAEGTIYGNSRYGLTTAILPAAAAGLDSTNTLSLGLRSNAQMVSGSAADRDKHTTLLNIGGEYLSFMTAALTGVNAYNVTSLNRALFGTSSASAKAVGSTFVYVDSRIAILKDLDLSLIGQTVYIKVTAFNTYGTGEQDISTVSAYNYTITGNMKALQTPVDFLTGVGGPQKPSNNATVGADTTNLNVTIGGGNLVKNSSFEGPTWAGGGNGPVPVGFALYCNSEGTTTTTSIVAGRTGGSAMQVAWTANTSTKGFYFLSGGGVDNSLAWQPNTTMMFSYYAKATGLAVGQPMMTAWNNAPTTIVAVSNPPLTTGWQRYIFRLVWGAVVDGNGYISIVSGGGNGTAAIIFDDIQVEVGDTVTAYGANSVARIGSNLYDIGNLPIATDAAIKNSSVTMGPNGVLGGSSGGGAITALPADNLVDGSIYGRYALLERTKLTTVEQGATAGDNLIANGGAENGTASWNMDPNYTAGTLTTSTVQKKSGLKSFLLNKAAVSNTLAASSNAIPVNPGDTYVVTFWTYAGAAFSAGLYLSIYQTAAYPAAGYISRTTFDNYNDFLGNGAGAVGVTQFTYTYTIPAGMYWASVQVLSYVSCDVNLYFEVSMQKQIAWQANIGGVGKPANYADVTASQPIVSQHSPTTGNALVTLADTNGRRMNKFGGNGTARDGDSVAFATTLPSVPNMAFLPGGNAASSGSNVAVQATGLSVSGFTMKARSQAVTAGGTVNDSTTGTRVTGDPDMILIRSNAGAPFDGNFKFNYAVTVGLITGTEPGQIDVQLYVRKAGSWVNVGSNSHGSSGSYSVTVAPGTVDYAAGVAEFGMSKSFSQGTGTALSGFGPVTYTLGSVVETVLTPAGSSAIPWLAIMS